jgi:hypothetical protein
MRNEIAKNTRVSNVKFMAAGRAPRLFTPITMHLLVDPTWATVGFNGIRNEVPNKANNRKPKKVVIVRLSQ